VRELSIGEILHDGNAISHHCILEGLDFVGMGVVCHAEEIELDHQAAIKVLPRDLRNGWKALE
jgi:hypothetical protein